MDIEKLTPPLTDGAPAGEDLSYDPVYLELEELVYANPDFGDENATEPDWRDIRDKSLKLFERSRDLRVATYLALSELVLNGVRGFRDGVKLIRSLVCDLWDSVHPQLDPEDNNDPLDRLNILSSLSPDAASYQDSMMFIQRLRNATLCDAPQLGRFSHRDIMIATGELESLDSSEHVDANLLRAAFMETPLDLLNDNLAAVDETLSDLAAIGDFLTSKLGVGASISFIRLETELKSIKKWLNDYLSQRGGGNAEEKDLSKNESTTEPVASDGESTAGNSVPGSTTASVETAVGDIDVINTRSYILRVLDKI
jgi:type VI secretion system protein ImpA